MGLNSIAEQFFQMRPRRFLAGQFDFFRHRFPAGKFKILAEIADVFFQHQIGAALAALLRNVWGVALAVQAHAQIRAALHADLAAAGIAGDGPRFAAVMTMSGHYNLRFWIYALRFASEKQPPAS